MNTLNRPISPILINKCIGVALVPVAGYAVWTSAKSLADFDAASLVSELFFTLLPSACMLIVAVFCVLFVLKAFRSEYIRKPAIVMAFLQILCISFLWVLNAWAGGDVTVAGDAGFVYAILFLWIFVILYLPSVIVATVCATIGLNVLLRPAKKDR
jgi:hypothetical protein